MVEIRVGSAGDVARRNGDQRPGLERHGFVVLEPPGAYLGALQVLQDADRAVFLFRGAPQAGDITRVLGMRAVRKVQPGHVHAQPHHFAQHGFGIARRSDGADNLGAASGREGELRRQITRNKIRLAWFQILPVGWYVCDVCLCDLLVWSRATRPRLVILTSELSRASCPRPHSCHTKTG